jgi:dihydroorotase
MIGFETALAVVWTELVNQSRLTKTQLVERMSVAPARILQIPGGRIQPEDPADVVLFDPTREWEVKLEEIVSKSKNSPFIGKKFLGKVESVWVDGKLRLENEIFQS